MNHVPKANPVPTPHKTVLLRQRSHEVVAHVPVGLIADEPHNIRCETVMMNSNLLKLSCASVEQIRLALLTSVGLEDCAGEPHGGSISDNRLNCRTGHRLKQINSADPIWAAE